MPAVHEIAAHGLDELRDAVAGLPAGDLVVALPANRALRLASDREVLDACALVDGSVAIAMSPVAPPAPGRAGRALHDLLRDGEGRLPYRATPEPLALCGPAGTVAAVLASVTPATGDDVEDLCAALLGGDHDVALDTAGQVLRVLDGTGTDVLVVDGALRAGGERPVAVVGGAGALAALEREALDGAVARAEALAVDPAHLRVGDLVVAGPEIAVVPLWSPELCDAVIRAAEATDAWSADPDDPVPGVEVSLAVVSPRLADALAADARERIWPALRTLWPEAAPTPIHDAFVIRYEPGPRTDRLPLHHDVAQVSGSVRLNAGYEGGALRFPRQGWGTDRVGVGDLVAWPSLVTHPHAAEPVTRGAKYGLTIWFALPT